MFTGCIELIVYKFRKINKFILEETTARETNEASWAYIMTLAFYMCVHLPQCILMCVGNGNGNELSLRNKNKNKMK